VNILAENNGIQNFGSSLNKQCKPGHENEIEDFLQLCIQIIFYEKISISGLVPQYVWKKSVETVDLLKTEPAYQVKTG
jgi:hypothetical protein